MPGSSLADAEEALDAVSCVHVYSLSKSKLKDAAASLYATDYDCSKDNLEAASKSVGTIVIYKFISF